MRLLTPAGLIIIAGIAVYSNSIGGEFIWDDYYLIQQNAFIKNPSHIPEIFTEDVEAGAGKESNAYRPLQIASYMLDYSLWRLDARGYHITNILLHIMAALSLFWFVDILYKNRLISLLAALFFVTHPIHTEAVAYISGRSDPLSFLFMLISFIYYIKCIDSEKKSFYILTVIAYTAALLSRENALIFPLLLLLYHFSFRRRINVKAFVSVSALALAYAIMRLTLLKPSAMHLVSSTTIFQRLPGAFVAIANYLRLIILPFGLHMEYGSRFFGFKNPAVIAGVILLIFISAYAFRKRGSGLIFFPVCWFFMALLPSLNIYPINAYMAEHWLYLPSVGFFIILAYGLNYIYGIRNLKYYALLVIVSLAVGYSFLAIRQNSYWREPVSFYERTIAYSKDNVRINNNLGLIYYDRGEKDKAIGFYEKALRVDPDRAEIYNNLALAYYDTGQKDKAIELFKRAVSIMPDTAETYNNLGLIYYKLGQREKAIEVYGRAIEKYPYCAMVYYNLATIYKDMGRVDEAVKLFKKAIDIDPDHIDAYNNLGGALLIGGRYDEALRLFKKALEIGPSHADTHNNLAVVYYRKGDYALAVKHCDEAIRLGSKVDPGFLKALKAHRR